MEAPLRRSIPILCVAAWLAAPLAAQPPRALAPLQPTPACDMCGQWNTPQAPFVLHGNTWYVGTHGLSAILVTSAEGHVLIDAGLRESAALVAASIRALGFKVEDIRLILTSHVHHDHAGGVALLQRLSGARVAALPPAAAVLRSGKPSRDDPQFGLLPAMDPVARVVAVRDGEVLRVGPLALTAHATPGHTRGSTSWTWTSCDSAGRCRAMAYADSQSPVSADDFLYSRSRAWPTAVADFRAGHAVIEQLPCDILVTPHPEASDLWTRLEARGHGNPDALVDPSACRRYAASARERLATRLATEDTVAATVRSRD